MKKLISQLGFLQESSFFKRFLPLFIFAAVLPYLLAVTFSSSSASRSNTLRLWFEPETVKINAGSSIQLTLMAAYENDTYLIPSIAGSFVTSENLQLDKSEFSLAKPFRGTVEAATVTVTAGFTPGTFSVTIPVESVTAQLEDVDVVVDPIVVFVQNAP